MKKIVVLLVGIIVNTNISLAQQELQKIYGKVSDSATNQPIEFANVVLMKQDSTFVTGAVSDSLGMYELKSKRIINGKDYLLQVTHLGHEKKMMKVNSAKSDNIFNIQLVSNNISLPDVTITGIRTKVKNRINFNYTFTDQMREKVRLTSRLLENIPTVFVDCNCTVHIKGSSNILILRNGIELTDNSLVDQIQPGTVKNVEIMYNIPSKYANRNYTAIMNIVTKREKGYNLMLDNKTAVDGSMNDTKVNIGFESEKSSLYFFYKQYYRGLKQDTENSILDQVGASLTNDKYAISPRKECDNEFFYGYSYQANKRLQFGVDGYLSLYREKFTEKNRPSHDLYSVKKEDINTQNYKGYADYKDEKNHLTAEVTFHKKPIKDYDTYYIDDNLINQHEDKELYGAKIDYNRQFDETAVLYSGIKYSHQNNSGFYNNRFTDETEKYLYNNYFAYGEYMKSLGDHWMIDAGLSFQHYRRSFSNGTKIEDTDVFPKFNVSYSWKDSHNLALGYSSYLQDPSVWQMISFIKKESPTICTQGNPYLKAEKRGTLSLEYSYSKGNFYLGTSAFYKRTNNPIVNLLSTEEQNAILGYTNIKNSDDYGIDLTLSSPITKWWSISCYGDARYRHISSNDYYKKNKLSFMAQVQSVWSIGSKITAILQYTHNSKELIYNGYCKSYDSSIGMLNYTLNDYLDLYMVFVQPLGNLKGQTRVYDKTGAIDMRDTVHSQKVMLCLTFTFNKGKKTKKKELYQDESKKY